LGKDKLGSLGFHVLVTETKEIRNTIAKLTENKTYQCFFRIFFLMASINMSKINGTKKAKSIFFSRKDLSLHL